jgi:hypothetical protein
MYGQGEKTLNTTLLEGDSGARLAHKAMNENSLLGPEGWASRFHVKARNDLFLLLDDGWQAGGTATFQLDPVKFPSFHGTTVQSLSALNREVQRHGWRGIALWCRNTPGGAADERLESQCNDAGIRYWKVDIGDPNFNLVRARDKRKIRLTLEHVHGELPVNGDWKSEGRFGTQPWTSRRMEILRHTDVYRTYDVTSILSMATTLDRTAEMLSSAADHAELLTLLNVEDEVYLAAAMGCTMGIMRHPLRGLRPADDPDLFFNGARNAKLRMDEVVRALRWQRIAAPFPCGIGKFESSAAILSDSWNFESGQTWQHELVGTTVRQGAPAILARNIDLPTVKARGETPFVFAARFPNGAVAVGAQERTRLDRAWYMPPCEVTLHVGDAPGPFGIFGEYENLVLNFDKAQQGRRVLAQDLAGDDAVDITSLVEFKGTGLHLSGKVLHQICLRDRTPGDISSPGTLVALI